MSESEFTIPQYMSASSSEDEEQAVQPKVVPTHKTWELKSAYESAEDAEAWINSQGIWTKGKCNDTNAGVKQYYRCNKEHARGKQCAAAVFLLYHADDFGVSAFCHWSGT